MYIIIYILYITYTEARFSTTKRVYGECMVKETYTNKTFFTFRPLHISTI